MKTVAEVGDWLARRGFEQWVQVFADNEIDGDALRELSEAHLKELGVPLGPRVKLLRAIEAFACDHVDKPTNVARTVEVAPTPAAAERRQLTVMFVDLVGSTALSAKLDPEEMGAVLRAYQNAVAGEIARFEGHVAKFMGDGVLAYFGWPVAHEDEAERAVRAGLAVRDAVGQLSGGDAPLVCRIGVATGLVVVGELIGQGTASEQTVVGDTPNLAARLQALAEPGQLVIGETTRRLLGASFALGDLGEHELKGIAQPVAAFSVTGERVLASRFEGRAEGLQPMVGRDQELALLLERWTQAKAGEGQAVLLVGEAGVGKSRISRALLDALSPEPHTRIRYQCSPYHSDTALWPVIQQLGHAARLSAAEPLEARIDKVEALLASAGQGTDAAPFFADLLGLDGSARYGKQELSPQAKRARTLAALTRQLVGLSGRQPLLLLIEDTHWLDPTTLELVELWLDATAAAPVLMLLTSRPDNQPALAGHPHVTRLSLNRLGRAGAEAIVGRLGGGHLPPATIDTIIARTDGVPLYVEELTKAVLETGETAIPASLHDSLMARLDRTLEVKEIAQIAACIGREFDYGLLAAVTDQPPEQLTAALDKLLQAELVFRRGSPPEAHYSFKHALVRDAAYESLLKSKRQSIHRRILDALAASDAEPQMLGHHAREAGLIERAIGHFEAAGREALARPAYLEAIANLRRAVEMARTLGDAGPSHELELQIAIGQASIAGFGYSAADTRAAFQRALDLLREIGESPLWTYCYYGNWVGRNVAAELRDALVLAEDMLRIAEAGNDDTGVVTALRMIGTTQMLSGRLVVAESRLAAASRLYDSERDRALLASTGQEPGVSIDCFMAHTLLLRGFPDRARRHIEAAVRVATELRHALTLAYVVGHETVFWLFAGDGERAVVPAERNRTFSEIHSIRSWEIWTFGFAVVLHSLAGRYEDALAAAERARPQFEASGTGLFLPLMLSGELRSLIALGRYASCEERLREVFARIETSGEHWIEADIHRIEGDLRVAEGDPAAAERCYRRAIDLACDQEAKLFELRATTSLARLWTERGERQRAQDLLAPVYDWFTEGFDTPDLIEAKALLDELR